MTRWLYLLARRCARNGWLVLGIWLLVAIAVIREIMGFGTVLGYALPARDLWWHQWTIMVMPPGAFFMLAILTWAARARLVKEEKK